MTIADFRLEDRPTRLSRKSRFRENPTADNGLPMTITLPPALNQLVDRLVHTARFADESDVVREALRVLERQELDESPALEAAILEGVSL
jgi:putative addiction module CopG family antidote